MPLYHRPSAVSELQQRPASDSSAGPVSAPPENLPPTPSPPAPERPARPAPTDNPGPGRPVVPASPDRTADTATDTGPAQRESSPAAPARVPTPDQAVRDTPQPSTRDRPSIPNPSSTGESVNPRDVAHAGTPETGRGDPRGGLAGSRELPRQPSTSEPIRALVPERRPERPAGSDSTPVQRQDLATTGDRPPGADRTTVTEPVTAGDRYRQEQLTGDTVSSTRYGIDVHRGPDGKFHLAGDRVGTYRLKTGQIVDARTGNFTVDDNKPPVGDIVARATKDPTTVRQYSPDGSSPADEKVVQAVQDRETATLRRAQLWAEQVQPAVDRLAQAGVRITEDSFAQNSRAGTRQLLRRHLGPSQMVQVMNAGVTYRQMRPEVVRASERLGDAGQHLLVAKEFPTATVVTGGKDERGTPGNLDGIVLVDAREQHSGALIALEAKGAGSALGSRLVDHAGTKIRAEQGSPEYLRHMLATDNKLAAVIADDPVLLDKLQRAATGADHDLRYVLVHTAPSGVVTGTDFILDPDRLQRCTVAVVGQPQPKEPRP